MAANRNGPRVEVVLFDAMYCLFEARESRARQLALVFKEEAGINKSAKLIWRVTQEIRHSLPASSDYKRDWVLFNRRIIAQLRKCQVEEVSEEVAARIQRRILWDVKLYEVREDIREFLQWLKRRSVRIGIASNQDRAALDNMMRAFDVEGFFTESCIFTSDRIAGTSGETVSKPHERFWKLVQEKLGLPPERVPFIGNSLRNDAPATRYGHTVLLFDRCGHQRPLLPANNDQLFFCQSPDKHLKPKLIALGLL